MNTSLQGSIRILVTVLSTMTVSGVLHASDSTSLGTAIQATKRPGNSIVGDVKDGMTCKYISTDSKIHCKYSDTPAEEFLVDRTITPSYSRFQPGKPGKITLSPNAHYAFINPVNISSSGSVNQHCRVALQFKTSRNEIIWIWHNELRYGSQGEHAVIDTNGDDLADLAVTGKWNGRLFGIMKWQPGSSSSTYSSAEQTYPARPDINAVTGNSRKRGCKPAATKVAQLKSLSTQNTVGLSVTVWRSENSP